MRKRKTIKDGIRNPELIPIETKDSHRVEKNVIKANSSFQAE